jgi:hypothetical protein
MRYYGIFRGVLGIDIRWFILTSRRDRARKLVSGNRSYKLCKGNPISGNGMKQDRAVAKGIKRQEVEKT